MSLIERAIKQLSGAPSAPEPAGAAGGIVHAAVTAAQKRPEPRRTPARLVTIDFDRLRERSYLVPGEAGALADEFRMIKRPLLRRAEARDETGNLIMVTSAGPGEGKTFTAVNLAMSIAAERDVTVLLVDADLGKPSLPDVLGFSSERGLTDILADAKLDLSDVILRTNQANLSIIPAGPRNALAHELLSSARTAALVKEIGARYPDRIVIFDSSPVLATTEPVVLSRHVGQIVFVVEAGGTARATVAEAIGRLAAPAAISLVLNKAARRGANGYGYGYGHGDRS
jgi:protein-tyrosine kinase